MAESSENTQEINELILKYKKRIQGIKIAEFVCTGVLLLAILASLTVIVVIQFTTGNTSYEVAAQICNTYTGIILGFVAMTVSLVGVILSFHNTKQSEESNLASAIEFANLQSRVCEIKEIEKTLSKTLEELEKKIIDFNRLKAIENRLEELSNEMRTSYDKNKGSATDKATTTSVKRESSSEPMETDEKQDSLT